MSDIGASNNKHRVVEFFRSLEKEVVSSEIYKGNKAFKELFDSLKKEVIKLP
jgi:hypothetical protein